MDEDGPSPCGGSHSEFSGSPGRSMPKGPILQGGTVGLAFGGVPDTYPRVRHRGRVLSGTPGRRYPMGGGGPSFSSFAAVTID